MGLREGELVLGRFEVIEVLPSWGELRRYAARDTVTGAVIDLQQPADEVRIRPGAAARFREATTNLPEHPAVSRPLAAGEHKGAPVAAYPQASAWHRHPTLDHDALRRLAGWLGSGAVLAGDALGSALRPEDLAIRPDGTPVIQATGVQPKDSRAVPDPFRPPGEGTPQDGALYGLGLLLFEAATGTRPFSPKTLSDLARQQQHPPRARTVRPDLPADLDGLIAALMSPDPAARRAALPQLRAAEPPHLSAELPEPEPPPSGAPVDELGIVVTREPTQRGARRDVPMAAWVVEATLDGVPESLRRRLAALAELPDEALARAAAEGVPVPVASARSEAEAEALAETMAAASVPLQVRPTQQRSPLVLGGLGAVALGLVGLLAGGGLAVLGVLPTLVTLALLAVAGLVLGAGGIAAGVGSLRSGVPAGLQRGHRIVSDGYPAEPPLVARMQEARRALLTSELSKPAQVDLLSALDALQEALPSAEREDERARVAVAVDDMIRTAAAASRRDADTAQAIEDAARRAQAARTAARELR